MGVNGASSQYSHEPDTPGHRGGGPDARGTAPSMLIAIAPTAADRVRLAELVDGCAPLLLVSTVEEARTLLGGGGRALPEEQRRLSVGGLQVDPDRHVVSWDGKEAGLTPLEHDLLTCLLAEPGRIWSFARLHQVVWGTRHMGAGSDLHSLVKRLRRKLEQLGAAVGIDAIRGVGFRLSNVAEAASLPRVAMQRGRASGVEPEPAAG